MKKVGPMVMVLLASLLLVGCGKLSVAFDAQNETPIVLREISKGEVMTEPVQPEREGYGFTGWFTGVSGGERWDFSSEVSSDMNLYARWEPVELTVEFIVDPESSDVVSQIVPYGSRAVIPEVPEIPGWQFTGWFEDAELTREFSREAVIVRDMRIHAGWEPLQSSLRYFTSDKEDVGSVAEERYPFGTDVTVTGVPERVGYRFAGWNTRPDGRGERVQPGDTITIGIEPVDLYAQWELPIATISAGSYHTMILLADGTLMGFGNNGNGQLGDGSRTSRDTPVAVADNVRFVTSGGGHTLYIDHDDVLWGFGANYEGQLGVISLFPKSKAVRISEEVSAAAAGGSHSLVLKRDGTLWAMGNNEDGQLGDGSTSNRSRPVQIADSVVEVAAGQYHSLFIKEDGTLWSMGWNRDGQLGDGTDTSRNRPILIDKDVIAIAAGGTHSLYTKGDGTLMAMGANQAGQLGDGSTTNRNKPVPVGEGVDAIAAGESHSLLIARDGKVWGTGSNQEQQLGLDGTADYSQWVDLGLEASLIAAGGSYSCIITDDGSVVGFGANDYGQLGPWMQ